MSQLIKELFSTKALEVAEPGQAFWYTSGTFGPFYINTHYLYGSAGEAEQLLGDIENELDFMPSFYDRILTKIRAQLEKSAVYRKVINSAVKKIEDEFDLSQIDIISGGERRDFFFSIPLADILKKPHLSVRKNGSTFLHSDKNTSDWDGTMLEKFNHSCVSQANLKDKTILHVADIITLASSWTNRWLPAVEKCCGSIEFGFAILDRCQGGLNVLAESGVETCVLKQTDKDFFAAAVDEGILTETQAEQAVVFLHDPVSYEREFFKINKKFIENEISQGGENGERALLYRKRYQPEVGS